MAAFDQLYGPTQVALAKKMAKDERKVLALYGKVLLECRAKIRKLYDTYAKDGKLDNADKSMANRLTQLQDEIQKIMDERLPGIIKCQAQLTGEMYEESFYRHCWCIDKGGTVGLDFGLLPKDAVDKAVKGTYDTFAKSRLLLDRTNAVRRLKEDIGLALIRGDSYQTLSAKIASHIGVDIEAAKKVRYLHKGLSAWSMLVARTEGQRVIAEGQQAAYQKARDLGCDIEEVWDATLDAKTRPEHAMLDQQVKDAEHGGWFVPRLNKYVPAPLHSGDPTFDLNCRCRVTARVKYLDGDAAKGKPQPYYEWAKNDYLKQEPIHAKTGELVNRFSEHLFDRMKDPTRLVSLAQIRNALEHPLVYDKKIEYDDKGRPRRTFFGRFATVGFNPETGIVTTCYPTGKRSLRKIYRQIEAEKT